jgi:hypothetical protein
MGMRTSVRMERRDKPEQSKGCKSPTPEGLATRGGPSPCVGVREGVGEALAGVLVGWAIDPRNQWHRGADAVMKRGRQHRRQRYRELSTDPARSKTPGMRGSSVRENREVPWSPMVVVDDASSWMVRGVVGRRPMGREGNAQSGRPR